jgi:hypothetical protein
MPDMPPLAEGSALTSVKDDATCTSSSSTPQDPSALPKCTCAKGGSARCVPKDKVPSNVSSQLASCSEGGPGVCVPDSLVKSGGAAPATCTTGFGEGRCLSLCVPQVADNASVLDRGRGSTCAEDERCVPCTNPLKNNEPTGVCDIGRQPVGACGSAKTSTTGTTSGAGTTPGAPACPYTGPPIIDVTKFPSCGDGARCVPTSVVPASAAALLKPCASGLCAPEKSIAAGGQYLPKTCKSIANAEGRCTNVNIPAVDAEKSSLPVDVCDPNERCAPCFDPTNAKDTGACRSVSCDAPKQPATTFKGCCSQGGVDRGKCVPQSMVPASEQSKLSDDDGHCSAGVELCAPNEMLDPSFVPPSCTGQGLVGSYSGVCLSSCIPLDPIQQLGTSQGTCKSGFFCAPCVALGSPTGAPGCPVP